LDYSNFKKINTKYYSNEDIITFGYIGPILKHKGVHILIDAFLKVKMDKIKLKIYGSYFHEILYFNSLKKLANADDRIVFMGRFDYNNLSNILADIDIEIFPSIWYETYCLALTEGLVHNVPVIASNTIGSAIEFLKNGSGILFNMGNVNELAQLIENIAKNSSMINNLKQHMKYPPLIEEEVLSYEKIYIQNIKSI